MTGARGVGKTVFVKACLNDYGHDVAARIASHPIAGSILATLQIAVIAVLFTAVIPWFCGTLAATIVHSAAAFSGVVATPFALVMATPLYWFARDVVQVRRAIRSADGAMEPKQSIEKRLSFPCTLLKRLRSAFPSNAKGQTLWGFTAVFCIRSLCLLGLFVLLTWRFVIVVDAVPSPEDATTQALTRGIAITILVYAFLAVGEFLVQWRILRRSDAPTANGLVSSAGTLNHFFMLWLPVLRVHVNLGFDNLDQASVARTMLAGLQQAHYSVLASRTSRLGFVSRILGLILVLFLSTHIAPLVERAPFYWTTSGETCCDTPAELLAKVWCANLAHSNLVWTGLDAFLMGLLLPLQEGMVLVRPSYLIVAFVLILAGHLWLPPLTRGRHSRLNARIRETLLSLDSATKRVQSELGFALAAGPQAAKLTLQKGPNQLTVDTPKLDPRQLEQQVIQILAEIDKCSLRPPLQRLLVPAGDVIFVFDELDKVGANRYFAGSDSLERELPLSTSHFGSDRNRHLHKLFSEMKNLVSSANARFVFIGGRDLGDEWLADRTARSPLLSTVFDGELYLPSLLVCDSEGHAEGASSSAGDPSLRLKEGTQLFLGAQIESAKRRQENYRSWSLPLLLPQEVTWRTTVPSPTVLVENLKLNSGPIESTLTRPTRTSPPECHCTPPTVPPPSRDVKQRFCDDLCAYLVVVGRGNPKRLGALLDEFVRGERSEHLLAFDYADRFRIALFARIFARVAPIVAYRTDDKVVQSAFYLTEFLFKFHRRAFHWSSLELLDELLDVHHAPDIRELLVKIVREWSQSYLVPIEAGLYRFRFDSSVAAEIRYISRISSTAMATFNFTLDETHLLKREYERRLYVARERSEDEFTTRSALGELYDFDDDYQQARYHYTAAVGSLDEALSREYKGSVLHVLGIVDSQQDDSSSTNRGLPRDKLNSLAVQGRAQINWSVPRVFNKLRIGLTYERSRDHVDALLHYRNARTLADSVMRDLLFSAVHHPTEATASEQNGGRRWLETTKDLQILLQPIFACVWIAEKSRAPSSGQKMLETGVQETGFRLRAADPEGFWLTLSDLHRNCGAFYLMRGVDWLESARAHYAAAAHCIKRHMKTSAESELDTASVAPRLAAILLALADVNLASSASVYSKKLGGQLLPKDDSDPAPSTEDGELRNKLLKSFRVGGQLEEALFGELDETYYAQQVNVDRLPADPRPVEGIEALHAHFKLSRAAVVLLERAGFLERAAREHVTQTRNLVHVLWAVRVHAWLDNQAPDPDVLAGLDENLLDEGVPASLKTEQIPWYRERNLCAFKLVMHGSDVNAYAELIHGLRTHPYPVIGSLAGIRTLILYLVLCQGSPPINLLELVQEFRRLNSEYDSPAHFTPFAYGATLAVWTVEAKRQGTAGLSKKAFDEIRDEALAALRMSVGTVTRQRSHRELIASLYFLDDGFNDRAVHIGQADQIFARGLAKALIARLTRDVA